MLNIAIVGAGYIGQNHIGAYKQLDDVAVVAIICRNADNGKKVCAQIGENCKHYTTLDAALAATHIDVVDICTPTNVHEEYVIAAANAKCHVLCEKPVTFELDSFDRMYEACRSNGVHFMVAQVARWWPEFMAIKDSLDQQKLGNLHMIYEKRLCQHPTWSTWHRNPAISGGGLYDLNVHDIDYLYSLFGMPASVYAIGWKSESGCWNHIVTALSWASGERAVCETSLEMTGNYPFSIELRVTGDQGTMEYAMTAGKNINDGEMGCNLVLYPAGTEEVIPVEVEQNDGFLCEIKAFLDAVRENKEVPITPEASREVLRIVLAVKESLENGCVVAL